MIIVGWGWSIEVRRTVKIMKIEVDSKELRRWIICN